MEFNSMSLSLHGISIAQTLELMFKPSVSIIILYIYITRHIDWGKI